MKKLKNALLLLLSVCMIFGASTNYYAATKSLTAKATGTLISSHYEHGSSCSLLRLAMYYKEKHVDENWYVEDWEYETLSGGYSAISDSMSNHAGYRFIHLDAYAYANGALEITLSDVPIE